MCSAWRLWARTEASVSPIVATALRHGVTTLTEGNRRWADWEGAGEDTPAVFLSGMLMAVLKVSEKRMNLVARS